MLGYSYAGHEDQPIEYIIKFKTGSSVSSGEQNIMHQEYFANLSIYNSNFLAYNWQTSSNTTLFPAIANQYYWFKLRVFGEEKSYYVSWDGENWKHLLTMTDTTLSSGKWQKMFPRMFFGLHSRNLNGYFQGTIDLLQMRIIVGGVTVFDGSTAVKGQDFGAAAYVQEVHDREFYKFNYQNMVLIPVPYTSDMTSCVIETKIMPHLFNIANAGVLDTSFDKTGASTQAANNVSTRLTISTDGKLVFRISSDGSTANYAVNITGTEILPTFQYVNIRYSYNADTGYVVEHSLDGGETWVVDGSSDYNTRPLASQGACFGLGINSATSSDNPFSIDGLVCLKDTKFTVDGQVVFDGSTAVNGEDYYIVTTKGDITETTKTQWHQKDLVKTRTDSYYNFFYNNNGYILLPKVFHPGTSTWEMVFKYYTHGQASADNTIFGGSTSTDGWGILVKIKNSHIVTYLSTTGGNWDIAAGTTGSYTFVNYKMYWIKVVYDGSRYSFYYSLDGENYTLDFTVENASPISGNATNGSRCFGRAHASGEYPKNYGRIYLEDCYIKIGDDYYFNGKTAEEGYDYKVMGYTLKENVYEWVLPTPTPVDDAEKIHVETFDGR